MRFRAVAIFVLTAAVVAGCAVSSARGYTPRATVGTGAPAPSLPPTVSASATMLPGNVVPFVDEPAAESEFVGTLPTQPNPPRPSGPRCEGSQLRGALSKWISKSVNNDGEKMDPVMAASLSGWVVVTNTSNKPCTLQGRVNAQLVDGGGELHIDYSNDINAAAETAVTGVPAGGLASLRLDWSAPFCTTITGPLSVHVVLPNNGGTLDATVRDPTVPGCLHEETHPDLAGGVFVSAFSPGDASARLRMAAYESTATFWSTGRAVRTKFKACPNRTPTCARRGTVSTVTSGPRPLTSTRPAGQGIVGCCCRRRRSPPVNVSSTSGAATALRRARLRGWPSPARSWASTCQRQC